jgi:hypothetical protein
LPGNGSSTPFHHKLIKILTPHKLCDLNTQLGFLITKRLHLSLKGTHFIINSNPLAESIANLVSHLLLSGLPSES